MTSHWKLLITSVVLALALTAGTAAPSAAAPQAPGKTATKPAATAAPTDKDIADAQAKGLVWVNTSSKVYHKGGEFFGKTKQGKFMTESDAQKAGYRAAKEPGSSKKTTTSRKK